MRKPTHKQQIFANIETHIAFYQHQMDTADRSHPNDQSYSIAMSSCERVKHDRAYLKRGTNWHVVRDRIYPYRCYLYPVILPVK